MASIQKIIPNLWFDSVAEQAVNFYVNIFKNSSIGDKTYYFKEGQEIHGKEEGTVLTIEFTIEGQEFLALNAGKEFKFNEAVSFIINCDTQEEIDYYWERLTAGGDVNAQQCGWLKDKFGLSWQVNTPLLEKMIKDNDHKKAARAFEAMMHMKKINIRQLQQAFNGNG